MIIYVDVLLIKNMVISYGILVITAEILNKKYHPLKLIIASFVGTILTIIALIYDLQTVFLLKMLVLSGMTKISFQCQTGREFIIALGGVTSVTFLMGGILSSSLQNYFEITLVGVLCTVTFFQYVRLYQKNQWKARNTYLMKLTLENQSIVLKAFLDTGNFLTYGFREEPVVIVSQESIQNKISPTLKELLTEDRLPAHPMLMLKRIRLVLWKGVDGIVKEKYGIKVKEASIQYEGMEIKRDLIIITTQNKFEGYDALIGLSALEGGNNSGNYPIVEPKGQTIYC